MAPVLEMEEFKDLKQFCLVVLLQDLIRRDPNFQLAMNDLARPYKYTLSNNSIVAGMSITIMRLLRQLVLIIYKLVDPHNYTTLSKPVQLPTLNTLYNEKQVLLNREEDFLNIGQPTLKPIESKKSQNIVLQSVTLLLLNILSYLNTQLEII